MEACATANGWGRELGKHGHSLRLIPTVYVKPFVKRQKNDAADAKAIVEAALRPTMRFVALKTEDKQARAMLFRTRQMFVGQRTQMPALICRACWPRCYARSVWAPHSESARIGSIVPSASVVIRPVAIALRTAASETPRCAA